MKRFLLILLLWPSALFTQSTVAAELQLQYAGFYDYLKQAANPEFNQVRPAFFLKAKDKPTNFCVEGATIFAGDKTYPVVVNQATAEFYLPFDKRIKDQRGYIQFSAPEICELSVAVVGRVYQAQISGEELIDVAAQIYGLMQKYAGSVRYFMPDWAALVIHYQDGSTAEYLKQRIPAKIDFKQPVAYIRLSMENSN